MRFDFSEIYLGKGINYFANDRPLQYLMGFLNQKGNQQLESLGSFVSNEMIEEAMFIDHYAKPELIMWGVLDNRVNGVWISPSHSRLLDRLQKFGVIRSSIPPGSLMNHFLSGYIISDSGLFCTITLTMQTVYALNKYGSKDLVERYLEKFIRDDNPWYGATYYTEIQGGSDLGSNTTKAKYDGKTWRISGTDKYFASNAGIADAAIVTARTKESPAGARGIRVFFVPALREDGTANYNIRRLKDKLGTVAVPTGEVELLDSEAYLLGSQETGIYIALEILTVSRIDDAIAAAGIARKSLWEAYLYARRRTAFGKPLADHTLMQRDLVEMEAEVEASTFLSVVAAYLFSEASNDRPPYGREYNLARAFSHMAKNTAAWSSDYVTRYSMEVFGGKGFLHEFPVEKFHRDAVVTSIWEGTTNIQALDFLELLSRKNTLVAIRDYLSTLIDDISDKALAGKLRELLEDSTDRLMKMITSSNPEFRARDIIDLMSFTSAAIIMHAVSSKAGSSGIMDVAKIYYWKHFKPELREPGTYESAAHWLEWMDVRKKGKTVN